MPSLFDPIQLGDIPAANRILMSPLTRGRATDDHVPTDIMVDYYRQRAGAGLIISEGTGISRQGLGWPNAPGLWTEAQAATLDDIRQAQDDYATAATNAIRAGFDGVQLHGANGYLIDQFLRDGTNLRDDDYGGSPENRIRFMRESVARVVDAIGAGRTGIRLSPNGETQGADDSDPASVFVPAAAALDALGIAFLELREIGQNGTFGSTDVPKLSPAIRKVFSGPLILNQDYSLEAAQADLDSGLADGIAFGRKYIANPDLVERFRTGAPLNADDMATWYSKGPEGYTDYPALETEAA